MYRESDDALLESLGWTVECQSPLEIRHTDGDFATGFAAKVLIDYLKSDAAAGDGASTGFVSATPVTELLALFDCVEKLLKIAAELPETDYDRWKRCFEFVFSDQCSTRIRALLDQLNISFDWYDPDMDYEDDVRAYANALMRLKAEITPFLAAMPAES